VIFDDVFEGGETLAAFWVFAAGASAVGIANAGALAVAFKVVFDLFVVKRVAEAYEHSRILNPWVLKLLLRSIITTVSVMKVILNSFIFSFQA